MNRHTLYFICPTTKKRIRARVNWLDVEAGKMGITFLEDRHYEGGHGVIDIDDKKSYELEETT